MPIFPKLVIYLLSLFGISQMGCKTMSITTPNTINPITSIDTFEPDSSTLYFPSATTDTSWNENGKINKFTNNWYSKHLRSMNEPVLYSLNDSLETYRFTYLGTWARPYTIRITLDDSLVVITKKITAGQGGYGVGKMGLNVSKRLELSDWETTMSKINKLGFWTMPTHGGAHGNDGSRWILEGYRNGNYHVVTRWTPDHYGPKNFAKVCMYFDKLFSQRP